MGYESLSTVVVLAIVVILMLIWLPRRTIKGMKRVIEHREDRFSPSLHLVDADSGTRFSDETVAAAKGVLMQSTEAHKGATSEERIAEIRALRHAAVRRRRAIAVSLLTITVVVLVCAFALHFSPLFALIPAALLAAVLALGVRASKQAVAWERKVARYHAKVKKRAAAERKRAQAEQAERARLRAQELALDELSECVPAPGRVEQALEARELAEARKVVDEQLKTDVVPEGEIRQAIARGKADRDAAVKRRKEEMSSKEETQTAEKAVDQTTERADAAPADVKEVGLSIHDERDNMAEEAKTVAVKSTQDLISFSLGAPRDGADVEVDAPESMEIKSTKQVAKAVPVETPSDEAEPLIPPSDAMGSMDADEAAARVDEGVHLREVDVPGFHDAEVRADVEAPDVTSDSLGTGLEAILARRSA